MPDSLEITLVEKAVKADNAQALILTFENAIRDHNDRLQAAAMSNLAAFFLDNDIFALEPISTEPNFMVPISSASFPAPVAAYAEFPERRMSRGRGRPRISQLRDTDDHGLDMNSSEAHATDSATKATSSITDYCDAHAPHRRRAHRKRRDLGN
jgi:hypothetical protein